MKGNLIKLCMLPVCLILAAGSSAGIAENFNSRKGAPVKTVNGFLQSDYRVFQYFDANREGWNLGMEGDSAMVSDIEVVVAGLSDFSGSYQQNGKVELRWSTSYETQTSSYIVERSTNGKSWKHAGRLKGRGESDGSHTYAYMDKVSRNIAFKTDLYYRLKQVSESGETALSKILILRLYNTRTLSMIGVTPDPLKNDIAVSVQLWEPSIVTMRITRNDGSQAMRKSVKLQKGLNNVMVEGSHGLQPGPYELEVIVNSKERMLVKLLKETSVVQR